MTQDIFNEIVERFRVQHPDFVEQAEWSLLEGDDSDSTKIEAQFMVSLKSNEKVYKIPILETLQTQDSPEPIERAILAINNKLLSRLQNIENLIL